VNTFIVLLVILVVVVVLLFQFANVNKRKSGLYPAHINHEAPHHDQKKYSIHSKGDQPKEDGIYNDVKF
jgi:hypothetical protein